MGKHEVRYDGTKNRLYIHISGFFRTEEARAVVDELESRLAEVRPDFDVITDISGYKPGLPAVAQEMRRGAEVVKAHGRRRAVRVVGRLVTGLLQFKRQLKGVFEEDRSVRYASSIEEADQILDEWSARGSQL